MIENKTLLITGGTGSWGQKATEILLTMNPHSIRIFSRGEYLQSEMAKRFKDERLRFCIGDVRDKDRLLRAMDGCDYVLHAAALKHVPIAEYNPHEAIRTNIDGSMNVIDAAIDCQVEKVMAISTDKAVNPCNLYGATKMVMEKLMVQANVYGGMFSCVRYGNVLGSRGSVVPLFREQSKTGKVTITHPDMTRFWITLEQGVRFVLDCMERMMGGEIYVPKIPSMKITDIASYLAPGCEQVVTGIRPGEKLHECLVTPDECAEDCGDRFVIYHDGTYGGLCYRSDSNTDWLDESRLAAML
jgi:UDP-N-acetylglucosamine 4,6-dehydratase/5-epimerase